LIFTPLARGGVQMWAIALIHIITLLALAAFLMSKSLAWNWEWFRTPLDMPILILLILIVISTIFSINQRISIRSATLFMNYLIIFYLTVHVFNSKKTLKGLICLIIGIAAFLAVFGFLKRFGMNPFRWWEYGDLNYSIEFFSATYGNHNHLAGYLEMSIPLLMGLLFMRFRGGRLIMLCYLILFTITALILSLSRGGWAGFLIGMCFMLLVLLNDSYFKHNRILVVLIGCIIITVFIILASTPVIERIMTFAEKEQEASLSSRIAIWGGILKMISDYPISGIGPGTFNIVFTQYQPPGIAAYYDMAHNDYLHLTSEIGLPLIAVIIWMVVAFYKKGFKKLKNPSLFVRCITMGTMTGITAILAHSVTDFNMHIPANALLFTILVAVTVSPLPEDLYYHHLKEC